MNKNFKYFLLQSIFLCSSINVNASEKFDILPDLPDLATVAQASSVSTIEQPITDAKSIGHNEPNFGTVFFSLIFVIMLIYVTGILYSKLNNIKINSLTKQNLNKKNNNPTVLSTTPLGANKTLHVVELEGKRMLIGASSTSIHLLKDLEEINDTDYDDAEYSKIEIPSIRIPRIEIPKIEIPGFTKVVKKNSKKDYIENDFDESSNDSFVFTEIYEESTNDNKKNHEEDNKENYIGTLFKTNDVTYNNIDKDKTQESSEHVVDPEEFALYKKYIN